MQMNSGFSFLHPLIAYHLVSYLIKNAERKNNDMKGKVKDVKGE